MTTGEYNAITAVWKPTLIMIRAAAARLGYRPNRKAQGLRANRSNTIGVMVFDVADPWCTLTLKGIQCALDATDMLPIIMDAQNQGKQFMRYLTLLMERRVEALIVVANWLLTDAAIIGELELIDIPIAIVGKDFTSRSLSCFLVNNELRGYLGAAAFLSRRPPPYRRHPRPARSG